MTISEGFEPIFERLRGMIEPYADRLVVDGDDAMNYSLNTTYVKQFHTPLFFSAAQVKKNYVSFHLMPVYIFPALLDDLSPALRKRMQGKSCFNFAKPEQLDAVEDELRQLTVRGFERMRDEYNL